MTSATTSRPDGPPLAAPLAVPRVAPQRRWRPALVWLAVALVAVGGLLAVAVLRRVGTTAEYLAVSNRVEAGRAISRADLSTVRITTDPALKPIRVADTNTVLGKYAAVTLLPGTLLTHDQVTDTAVPGPGKQLVGISLSEDQLPTDRVKPGAQLLLVVTTDDNPFSTSKQQQEAITPPLSIKAAAVDVRAGEKEGTTLVNVAVAERDGPLVAARAAAGRIVVTLVQGN